MQLPPCRPIAIAPIIILFFALWQQSPAQRQDARISPDEAITLPPPSDARFQSAATLDSATLAVWGTIASDGNGGWRNAIEAQGARRHGTIAPPVEITEPESRPAWFAQVIPLRSYFVVIWNDYRADAPGLYARKVRGDGGPIGPAFRIARSYANPLSNGRVLTIGRPDRGALLLWSDAMDESVHGVHLDGMGMLDAEQRQWGAGKITATPLPRLPGPTLLSVGTNRYLVDDAGRIDPRAIPAQRLDLPFAIGPDTSMVRLAYGVVEYYRSIFDDAPERTVSIPNFTATPTTSAIGRDADGTTHLYWTAFESIPGDAWNSGRWSITGHQIRVAPDGSLSTDTVLFQQGGYSGPATGYGDYRVISLYDIRREEGCGGSVLIRFVWNVRWTVHGNPQPNGSFSTMVSFDGDRRYLDDSLGFHIECRSLAPQPITRLAGQIGIFSLALRDTTLTLAATHSDVRGNAPQTDPAIFTRNDELFVTWRSPGEPYKNICSRWDRRSGAAVPIDTVEVKPPPLQSAYEVTERYTWQDQSIAIAPGMSAFGTFGQSRLSEIYHITPASWFSLTRFWSQFSAWIALPSGWKSLLDYNDPAPKADIPPLNHAWHGGGIAGYDPNSGAIMVKSAFIFNGNTTSVALHAFDAEGSAHWVDTVSNPIADENYLPIGEREYLRITKAEARVIRKRERVRTIAFVEPAVAAGYLRLLGNRFLRWGWSNSIGASLYLEIYDLNGTLAASRRIDAPGALRGTVTFAENPIDSAIAILWGGRPGAHATILDRDLGVHESDLPLSRTTDSVGWVRAAYRGDSLFVVWEDFRNGPADIYSNAQQVERLAASPIVHDREGAFSVELLPNPLRDGRALLRLHGSVGEARVSIADALGRVVRRLEVERGERIIDLSGLAGGSYLVEVTNGSTRAVTRIVVVR